MRIWYVIHMKNESIVTIQIILIVSLLAVGDPKIVLKNPLLLSIFLTGLSLIVLATVNLGLKSYSIFPSPSKSNRLVTWGIYRFIRHPYYTGLVLTGIAFLLSKFSLFLLVLFVLFVLIHKIKADWEEELLTKIYPKYQNYKKKTKKFIPFLY